MMRKRAQGTKESALPRAVRSAVLLPPIRRAALSWLMKRNVLCVAVLAAGLSFASAASFPAKAAVAGSGSSSDPYRGNPELSVGDIMRAGSYYTKLTPQNGKQLHFQAQFAPKSYTLLFSAAGGAFPDGSREQTASVEYNDGSGKSSKTITVPAKDPQREGVRFAGWYLKGNRSADGCLIRTGSRFMIAAEDAGDRALAEMNGDRVVARALWQRNTAPEAEDGNGAELPPPGGTAFDLWDAAHPNNHVIEKLPEAQDRESYRRLHGRTAYQYGRILFSAETEGAESYRFFVDGKEREENRTGRFCLAEIGRELNGKEVKCEIMMADGATKLTAKTSVTVYSLPHLLETKKQFKKTETGKAEIINEKMRTEEAGERAGAEE